MSRLTPEQRLATFLAFRMDLPLTEVARLTGTSVAGVKMRLMRARRAGTHLQAAQKRVL